MTTDTIREAMTPGTVTTLGALRPGDVGVFVHHKGIETPRFAFLKVVERPGWGRVVVAQFEGGGYIDEPWLARPVRYLGPGRIEPARIVMEGEGDRIAELEEQVRTLRAALQHIENMGQSAVPDHFQFRVRARSFARAALAAAMETVRNTAYGRTYVRRTADGEQRSYLDDCELLARWLVANAGELVRKVDCEACGGDGFAWDPDERDEHGDAPCERCNANGYTLDPLFGEGGK